MICRSCYDALKNANNIREMCLASKKQLDDVVMVLRCCLCSEIFEGDDALRSHVWEKHRVKIKNLGEMMYKCSICLKKFRNKQEIEEHRTCETCFESCSNDMTFEKHKKSHETPKEMIIKEEILIETHEKSETIDEELEKIPKFQIKKPLKRKKIEKSSIFSEETQTKTKNKYSRCCCQCEIRFPTIKKRNEHFTQSHQDAIKQNPNPSKFACYLCFEEFTNVRDRVTHMRRGYGSFKCSKCPLAFETQRAISRHYELVHKIPQIYECTLCEKTFTKVVSYDSHIHHFHSELSKFECNICQKVFNRKHDLEEHMNAHLGLKPHQCHVCSARFPRVSALKVHLRSHTGEKPYKCEYCEKRFGHYTDWKRYVSVIINKFDFFFCVKIVKKCILN